MDKTTIIVISVAALIIIKFILIAVGCRKRKCKKYEPKENV